MHDVLTLILAGGKGTRLEPLTRDRAKPAVPFGGQYRIIDFTLSNCVNSGLRKVLVLTQFKAGSLNQHIHKGWSFLSGQMGEFIDVLPPQQRVSEGWYTGTADAIYQNIYHIESEKPKYVLILAGDHIYKMNYGEMIEQHASTGADLTIGCIPVPLAESKHFGVVLTSNGGRATGFIEKPAQADPMPGDPDHFLASMGIYVFTTEKLFNLLIDDAADSQSSHDFGRNIIPTMIEKSKVYAFRFRDRNKKAVPYWRDVGTLDAYYHANIDLAAVDPVLNLYDTDWPIRTALRQLPPPKFVHNERVDGQLRRGEAIESVVCAGSIVSGGQVRHSVLAAHVRINSYALVEESILFDNVNVGRRCKIRRAIIDKHVQIPEGMTIGYNRQVDEAAGLTFSDNGIVVVPKGHSFEKK